MSIDFKALWQKYQKYIYVFFGFFGGMFILMLIADAWIIPAMVHSSGTVKVPNITGKNQSDAEQILANLELKGKKIGEQFSTNLPPGYVLNQNPKPGTLVKIGRPINLLISKGGEKALVPYLINQNLRNAKVTLLQKGLILGNIVYENSDSIGTDTVLSQSLPSGREIAYGSSIDLTVSRGTSATTKVPILTGRTLQEAEILLKESGLKIGNLNETRDEAFSGTFMRNTIVEQDPKAGETVPLTTGITVKIFK
jgi:serine/threonine-protein kinase